MSTEDKGEGILTMCVFCDRHALNGPILMTYNEVAQMFWQRSGRQPVTTISPKQVQWITREWQRSGNHGRPYGSFEGRTFWELGHNYNGSGRLVTKPLAPEGLNAARTTDAEGGR